MGCLDAVLTAVPLFLSGDGARCPEPGDGRGAGEGRACVPAGWGGGPVWRSLQGQQRRLSSFFNTTFNIGQLENLGSLVDSFLSFSLSLYFHTLRLWIVYSKKLQRNRFKSWIWTIKLPWINRSTERRVIRWFDKCCSFFPQQRVL